MTLGPLDGGSRADALDAAARQRRPKFSPIPMSPDAIALQGIRCRSMEIPSPASSTRSPARPVMRSTPSARSTRWSMARRRCRSHGRHFSRKRCSAFVGNLREEFRRRAYRRAGHRQGRSAAGASSTAAYGRRGAPFLATNAAVAQGAVLLLSGSVRACLATSLRRGERENALRLAANFAADFDGARREGRRRYWRCGARSMACCTSAGVFDDGAVEEDLSAFGLVLRAVRCAMPTDAPRSASTRRGGADAAEWAAHRPRGFGDARRRRAPRHGGTASHSRGG